MSDNEAHGVKDPERFGEIPSSRAASRPVALFIPCYVEHLRPEVGLACAEILTELDIDWLYPHKQACCGQPVFNLGQHDAATPAARKFLRTFGDERFGDIVAPSGSCVAMVRRYPSLPDLSSGERDALRDLSERTYEFSDFLVNTVGIPGNPNLDMALEMRVCIQDSCHTLRELGIESAPRQLLELVRGLTTIDLKDTECCGFGGFYSLKLPEISCKQADERLAALARAETSTLVSTDVSCLTHIDARARARGVPFKGLHIAELLTMALKPAKVTA